MFNRHLKNLLEKKNYLLSLSHLIWSLVDIVQIERCAFAAGQICHEHHIIIILLIDVGQITLPSLIMLLENLTN